MQAFKKFLNVFFFILLVVRNVKIKSQY